MKPLSSQIFTTHSPETFEKLALEIFYLQASHCKVYHDYITNLGIKPQQVTQVKDIPFLPISFFKTHKVVSSEMPSQMVFSSSGTTGMITSKHFVSDLNIYEQSFNQAFEAFYGPAEDICILALLPSYLEREGSSLIYMVDSLIAKTQHPESGYYLHNHDELFQMLNSLKDRKQKTLLIGVTYALLDFVEQFQIDFPELIVMETGGMKGKRKEMVREELHEILCGGFSVSTIHSEYGMTELLSQAYSKGNGIFECPPWMKILLRDPLDPLSTSNELKSGGINIIDLANINSCSFIASQDLGKLHSHGNFEVLGRFDNADIRGCNLLVQ